MSWLFLTMSIQPGADGVALFYCSKRFVLIDRLRLSLTGMAMEVLNSSTNENIPGSQSRYKALKWKIGNCPEVAIILLLKDRFSKKKIVASSAHLFWDPRWPDVKVYQVLTHGAVIFFFREKNGFL